MKQRSRLSLVALSAIATFNTSRLMFPDDPSFAKVLNITGNDGVDTGGQAVRATDTNSGQQQQAAVGDEIRQSGHPGDLAAAALVGQQQAQSDAAAQAGDVTEAKGTFITDDNVTSTTAVGDPPAGTEQAQQT